jgi:hypothetical protein
MCDQGSGFSAPKPHRPEQALALPHAQGYTVGALQVMGEQLSIPEILQVPQIARGESQVPLDCLPGAFVQSPRASRPLGFPQCAQTLGFEASHPTFDRRWMLPQPLGDLIATVALGNEQNTVQPVVVAGLFRAIDLVLQSESHDGGVGDSELSHAQLYRGHATSARYYAALLLTLCISVRKFETSSRTCPFHASSSINSAGKVIAVAWIVESQQSPAHDV